MRTSSWTLSGAAALLVAAAGGDADAARPRSVRESFPVLMQGAPRAKVAVTRWAATERRSERTRIVLKFTRVRNRQTYATWGDDPLDDLSRFGLFAPFRVTAKRGAITLRYDTRDGELPFGGDYEDLAGHAFQLRDEQGNVLAAGTYPEVPGPR